MPSFVSSRHTVVAGRSTCLRRTLMYCQAMSENVKHHATIVLERDYDSTPSRVFTEFADPVVRARWSAPPGDELTYEEAAFKVGGRDVFRCGPMGDPRFRGETLYHVIEPHTCVISTETLEAGGQHLAVSLSTLELRPTGHGTKLKLTIQIVSSVGKTIIKGFESGNRSALEGLAAHLANLTDCNSVD
jgi:uncharacterized protein YndB with AHSA1/START domain